MTLSAPVVTRLSNQSMNCSRLCKPNSDNPTIYFEYDILTHTLMTGETVVYVFLLGRSVLQKEASHGIRSCRAHNVDLAGHTAYTAADCRAGLRVVPPAPVRPVNRTTRLARDG